MGSVIILGVVICVAICFVVTYFRSNRKRTQQRNFIRRFIESVNNGERIIYGVDAFCDNHLLDENGKCIYFGDIDVKIKSYVNIPIQLGGRYVYQAYISRCCFYDDTIILHLSPVDEMVSYQCLIVNANKCSVTCYHPVLRRFTLWISGYDIFSVGKTITLRPQITDSEFGGYQLEYAILNHS